MTDPSVRSGRVVDMNDDRHAIPGTLSPYGHKTLARCIGVPAMKPDTTQIVMTSADGLTVVMDGEPDDRDRDLIWRILSGERPPHSIPGAACYQDAEGTIPAAPGEPVRYVRIPNREGRLKAASQQTLAQHAEVFERLAAADHRPAPTDTCRCNGGDDPC